MTMLFISFSYGDPIRINQPAIPVGSKLNPGISCKDIQTNGGTVSKNYYIRLAGQTVQVYCDQTTAGGGWTLVYSYKFTDPENFNHGTNAVTPRPSWPSDGDVLVSTTTPLSETDYNAMPYDQWKLLGKEFLVKSNINNWIACSDGTGSLAGWRSGTLSCKMVKNVMKTCGNVVPNGIAVDFYERGIDIYDSRVPSPTLQCYYSLETKVGPETWPTHDPCGGFEPPNLCGVSVPRGNIYFR